MVCSSLSDNSERLTKGNSPSLIGSYKRIRGLKRPLVMFGVWPVRASLGIRSVVRSRDRSQLDLSARIDSCALPASSIQSMWSAEAGAVHDVQAAPNNSTLGRR